MTVNEEAVNAADDCAGCGHPVTHHDAGECWTNGNGTESVENACGCGWYEPIARAAEVRGQG